MLYAVCFCGAPLAVDLSYEQANHLIDRIESDLRERRWNYGRHQDNFNHTETPSPRFDGYYFNHFAKRFPAFVANYKF